MPSACLMPCASTRWAELVQLHCKHPIGTRTSSRACKVADMHQAAAECPLPDSPKHVKPSTAIGDGTQGLTEVALVVLVKLKAHTRHHMHLRLPEPPCTFSVWQGHAASSPVPLT